MNRFQRSWVLFKSSLAVMLQNKKLLIFPALIAACTIFIAVLFLTPVAFQSTGFSYGSMQHWQKVMNSVFVSSHQEPGAAAAGSGQNAIRPVAVAYFAVLYFTSMLAATFLNVAFYREILKALSGETVSIRAGLLFACSRWKSILMWTLFAGLVGYVIKALEERFGLVGRIILRILGTAWSIACVFVIPVIITEAETSNPFAILKKSALTLKQTWGESLIGFAGVSFGGLIVLMGSLVILGGAVALSIVLHSPWVIFLVVCGWLLFMFAFSYLMSVASQIFRCALFLYASQGTIPAPFNTEMINLAWKVKKT